MSSQAVDGLIAAALSGEHEAFAECCAVDVHYEDPLSQGALTGLYSLAEHAAALRRSFVDVRIDRSGPELADDGHVAAPLRLQGVHAESLGQFPATGKPVTVQAILLAEVQPDGRLRRIRVFFDLYDSGRQLGLLPKPGSAAERAMLLARGFGLR
ncbi:MAG TPA: ester cyclase [Baekduia sp.]|nr:ester cyclase [Baekduia sp.]